jgi:hypothetical protein
MEQQVRMPKLGLRQRERLSVQENGTLYPYLWFPPAQGIASLEHIEKHSSERLNGRFLRQSWMWEDYFCSGSFTS